MLLNPTLVVCQQLSPAAYVQLGGRWGLAEMNLIKAGFGFEDHLITRVFVQSDRDAELLAAECTPADGVQWNMLQPRGEPGHDRRTSGGARARVILGDSRRGQLSNAQPLWILSSYSTITSATELLDTARIVLTSRVLR